MYVCLYVCKVCMYIIDLSHLSQSQKLKNFLTSDTYNPSCFLSLCSPLLFCTCIESTYLFMSYLALWSCNSTLPARGMLSKTWNREESWCVDATNKKNRDNQDILLFLICMQLSIPKIIISNFTPRKINSWPQKQRRGTLPSTIFALKKLDDFTWKKGSRRVSTFKKY